MWRKQDRASSLQELHRPPGQVPRGGIYAFDVRQTLTPYLLPWLLLLEATSFWLSLSLALSRSLSLSISLSPSGPVLCVQTCMGPARLNGHALGHRRQKCVGCAEHSKTQDSKTHTHTRTPPHPLTHTHNTDTHTHTPHTRTHTHTHTHTHSHTHTIQTHTHTHHTHAHTHTHTHTPTPTHTHTQYRHTHTHIPRCASVARQMKRRGAAVQGRAWFSGMAWIDLRS